MPYTTSGLDAAVNGIASAGTHIAFHTADPAGVAGASQHGTRAQTTWAAASAGASGSRERVGSQVSVSVAAGTTLTHWSVNTASTSGTMVYYAALAANETFGAAGTIQHTPTLRSQNPA